MKPPDKSAFVLALMELAIAAFALSDLCESHDLSKDWGGPLWLVIGLIWLYRAYRPWRAGGEVEA